MSKTCNWYGGCVELAGWEGLCPFHFDACERPMHADAQREHEARQAVTAQREAAPEVHTEEAA